MYSSTRPHTATVSVVLPALNEARNLPRVLARIPALVDEVVVVDGGSDDGTVDVARAHRPGIVVVGQPAPGKGAAVAAGLLAATGDIAVLLDADGSMDPAEIPAFVGALAAGADLVKGSRYLAGAGSHDLTWLRSLGNRGLGLTVNLLYGQRWSELCYGYAALWVDLLDPLAIAELARGAPVESVVGPAAHPLPWRPTAYGHGFEIEAVLFCRAVRAGLRVVEVASYEHRRRHGQSKLLTFRDGFRVLGAVLRERRHAAAAVAATPANAA